MDDKWRKAHDRSITKVFNRFSGKIVDPADPADPVLEEMRQEAIMCFSHLRLLPPGTAPDRSEPYQITRINVPLVADGQGRLRVGSRFTRG